MFDLRKIGIAHRNIKNIENKEQKNFQKTLKERKKMTRPNLETENAYTAISSNAISNTLLEQPKGLDSIKISIDNKKQSFEQKLPIKIKDTSIKAVIRPNEEVVVSHTFEIDLDDLEDFND